MPQLNKLKNDILVMGMLAITAISLIVSIYKNHMYKKLKKETDQKLYSVETLHEIELDSMKLRIVQDSLYIVDLQRIKQINNLNLQDKHDKANHSAIISIIPNASDAQRDRIWATYTPKN